MLELRGGLACMHKSEGGCWEVGGVATTCDAGAAGWSAPRSPAAAQRDFLTNMVK